MHSPVAHIATHGLDVKGRKPRGEHPRIEWFNQRFMVIWLFIPKHMRVSRGSHPKHGGEKIMPAATHSLFYAI